MTLRKANLIKIQEPNGERKQKEFSVWVVGGNPREIFQGLL